MLFLTFGSDKNKCREKHSALVKTLASRNPAASVFRVSSENFSAGAFEEMIFGQTLFAQKFIVACDNLLKEKSALEYFKENLDRVEKSDNIFIFLETEDALPYGATIEDKVKAEKRRKDIETLGKKAFKKQEFSARPAAAGFNVYSLVDAFSTGDKKKSWVLYQEALMNDISPEEILWKLIWQVDNMLLVKKTKDQKTIKLKPFVFGKAKVSARNFSETELKDLSSRFLSLYHETYFGSDEFQMGLEKILMG